MSTPPQPSAVGNPSQARELDEDLQSFIKLYIGSALSAVAETTKKRPGDEENDNAENPTLLMPDKKAYHTFGHVYSRQDDPFTNIDAIVNFGIKYEMAQSSDEERPALSTRDSQLHHSWELLCSIIPNFRRQMLALSEKRQARKADCQEIHEGVTNARSDDTSSLKAWIPSYILINPTHSLSPAILIKSKLKNDHGFYHPITASLLCPVKYPDTDETYTAIRAGRLPLTAGLLPRFLFPDGHIHDPTDIANNLLRGHVMYRAAKHIFQGPSSSLEGPGAHRGKQSNASICFITSMTPRLIAYVALQVRFALSSATSWAAKDSTFSYVDFYWHIVGLLGDEEGKEIIQFYNHQIFGTQDPQQNSVGIGTDDEVEDEYELIKQQRAAKRARI